MEIDWITVAAQIVNFLVLAWLLHKFLYGPITRAMDRREQRIAQRLNEADARRADAENEARAYHSQQAELENRRDAILEAARQDAETERKRLLEDARQEIETQKEAWRNDMQQQRVEFLRTIRQRAQEHFFDLAQRALADLANADLEEQMSRIFLTRLASLDAAEKSRLAEGGRKADGKATVRHAFALPPGAQRDIAKAVQVEILPDAAVTFEQDPGILCGLELKLGGQTVAWSLDSYFEALVAEVDRDLGDSAPEPNATQET
jgi:F-type H+-transporting ATPase subunit b